MGGVRPWRGKATAKLFSTNIWQINGGTGKEIGLFAVQDDGTIIFTDSRYPKDPPIHMTSWGSAITWGAKQAAPEAPIADEPSTVEPIGFWRMNGEGEFTVILEKRSASHAIN